jgi:4-hydroxythreonine-4-phosphate dehydrogenase/1,2-dihydroxy-3,5-cyclohexadiene-1,4-dicarboxylate dehydrogenase
MDLPQAVPVTRIAIPIGDPNGIGPEIAIKTAVALRNDSRLRLTLIGPQAVMKVTAHQLEVEDFKNFSCVFTADLPSEMHRPGVVCAEAGKVTIEAATKAIQETQSGNFDAVVAAPHHETAVHLAGIAFSGYPSLVAAATRQPEDSVFMMLVGGNMRIVHVTLHEGVQTALNHITQERIERAVHAGVSALHRLGVTQPRIGMFGINPHAGEKGLFGQEDELISRPAAQRLREQGLNIEGPQGADTLLATREHDLYVAMFHDQGHIPIKLLYPHRASALSIGSDVVLSSVGHGSAMDIAGQGIANPEAMIRTVLLLAGITNESQV